MSHASTLQSLYGQRSKHSGYQEVHPTLAGLLAPGTGPVANERDRLRQRYFDAAVPCAGARVLDIGANTGYFSFAALQRGAASVVCYEGNPVHARFIETAASALGLQRRLEVRCAYYDFDAMPPEQFDLTYCLNVLHHLGDDFGDPALTLAQARGRMLAGVNRLSATTHTLVLQLGFNWKGDVRHPLFEGGQKAAMIEFVRAGIDATWWLDEVVAADARRGYAPVDAGNVARDDSLGEFMNRPIFLLRARRARD